MARFYEAQVLEDGALAFLPLHDAAGSTSVQNRVGSNSNGTAQGITFGVAANVVGSFGTAAQQAISTGQILFSLTKSVDNLSTEIFAKPNTTTVAHTTASGRYAGTSGSPQYVIHASHSGAGNGDTIAGVGIAVGTNGVRVYAHTGDYLPCILSWDGALSATVYHHIVVTVTNNVPRLYVNGILRATGTTTEKRLTQSTEVFTGTYGRFTGQALLLAQYPTALTAAQVLDHYDKSLIAPRGPIGATSTYGGSAYGGGQPISSGEFSGGMRATAAGVATVRPKMTVISGTGDMVLVPTETGDNDDVIVTTREGPGSFSTGSSGRATVTMGLGAFMSMVSVADGVATVDYNDVGVAFANNGQSDGVASVESNRMLVILATEFFVIYTSKPPYTAPDVLLARRIGPQLPDRFTSAPGGFWIGGDMIGGDVQPLEPAPLNGQLYAFTTSRATVTIRATQIFATRSTSAGRATMTIAGTQVHSVRCTSNGVAATRSINGLVNGWYLSSPMQMEATSNGLGRPRDQFGTFGRWYLGSSTRMEATSNGRTRMRTLSSTFDSWYLGSSVRMTATSAGRATMLNYVGSRVYIDAMTSAGKGGARDQFGTAGRWYLGSSTRMAATSAGKANTRDVFGNLGKWYLAGAERIVATSAGRAGSGGNYLSSPIRAQATAAGKGGGIIYMGSRVYMSGTSPGKAGGFCTLGGTAILPNAFMRGVGGWVLGEKFLAAHVMAGVGILADVRLAGTQRQSITSRGVGSMRENSILLRMTSNGSSRGTEFDKPPFAFVVRAGAKGQYHSPYHHFSPYLNPYRQDGSETGFTIYMSSRVGFANDHPTEHHRGGFPPYPQGPSRMAGRSTFTFPYEMIAIANAGCRSFHGYRSDFYFVAPDRKNWVRIGQPRPENDGYTGAEGVRMHQFSPDYMSAVTVGQPVPRRWAGAHLDGLWYMSSRVYKGFTSRGISSMTHKRVDEFDVFAKGGGIWTLGVDNRQMGETISDGVGGWDPNYLPDIRLLRTTMRGVAGGQATQAGNVHFGPGLITSRGIGTFDIDPGLIKTVINGIGFMFPIERPTGVFMEWGLGKFFWVDPDNFPRADPLLIPKSSAGIAHVEIEIDTIPIMRQQIDGVGLMGGKGLEGIEKGLTWTEARSGSYPWVKTLQSPDVETPFPRRPARPGYDSPFFGGNGRVFMPQGVIISFTPVEVVWNPNGVGRMRADQTVFYILRWQQHSGLHSNGPGSLFYDSNDRFIREDGGFENFGSGRVGGIGRMLVKGDRRLAGISRGRADVRIRKDLTGRFAHNLFANGIAAMLKWDLSGGEPPLDRYGNMLRYFFIPIPDWGQIWPRKETQHGQPVG